MSDCKNTGILLVSHGACCTGMLDTVEMLAGELVDIAALPLCLGADPGEYQKSIESWLDGYGTNAVILIDIMGGTPFNTVMRIANEREVHAVTGLSVAMAIETAVNRGFMKPDELCRHLVECVPESIVSIEGLLSALSSQEDDDEEDE